MADYTGGAMAEMFRMARANKDNLNNSMRMALEMDEARKKRLDNKELRELEEEGRNSRAKMDIDKDKELNQAKINYYKKLAKKNDSRYLNTSYGVFDTMSEKYIDIPKKAENKTQNWTTQMKEDAQAYGINPDTGLPYTGAQYAKRQTQKRRSKNKKNKKYDIKL